MEITLKFTDEVARRTEYFLQKRYRTRAKLAKLAKIAVLNEAAYQAKIELLAEKIKGRGKP